MLNPEGAATRFSSSMGVAETPRATAARAASAVKNLTMVRLLERVD